MRAPMAGGQRVADALTRQTEAVADDGLRDVLVVDGPFGWSGVYPLDWPEFVQGDVFSRHCNLYFVKLTASSTLKERAPTVVEKTHYRLADGDRLLRDADLCTACLNKGCPCNRNAAAGRQDVPGKLILPL